MQSKIENELKRVDFKSDEDLNNFISSLRQLITDYEQDLYDKGTYSKQNQVLVKSWRSKLNKLSNKNVDEVLESTVHILNRQIRKIDSNNALLNKGTIKLMGLDYTNTDIDRELVGTKNKIVEKMNAEGREIYVMWCAFYIFLGACIFVLLDKYILKIYT